MNSFGIQFTAPVTTISPDALSPKEAFIEVSVDNSRQTRWKFRIRPGWSADARLMIGVNPLPLPGFAPLCTANNVCGEAGNLLRLP